MLHASKKDNLCNYLLLLYNMSAEQNKNTITQFYSAFKNKDYKTMQECYANEASFNDAVFIDLNASQVKAMWEMLCKRGKDLILEYSNITADETSGTAKWIATYTFSTTGKKVVNKIEAKFKFKDGLIIQHTDAFDFYKWAKQAFGITGLLIGWTAFFKTKVQNKAKGNLKEFMKK